MFSEHFQVFLFSICKKKWFKAVPKNSDENEILAQATEIIRDLPSFWAAVCRVNATKGFSVN